MWAIVGIGGVVVGVVGTLLWVGIALAKGFRW